MRHVPAVAHEESAVEMDAADSARAAGELGIGSIVPRADDCVSDGRRHLPGVSRIRHRVKERERRSALMRVAGGNDDAVSRNAGAIFDRLAGDVGGFALDDAGVDADQSQRRLAVVDHARGGQQRIVNAGHRARAVGAGGHCAGRRSDVGMSEAGFEHRRILARLGFGYNRRDVSLTLFRAVAVPRPACRR